MKRSVAASLACVAYLAAASSANAAEVRSDSMNWETAGPVNLPPKTQDGKVANTSSASRWIVGAKTDSQIAATVERFRVRKAAGLPGTYLVGADRARQFAKVLNKRKALLYAEPDSRFSRAGAGSIEPETYSLLSYQWALPLLRSGLSPPRVSNKSPRLAVIDSQVDTTHPEFRTSELASTGKATPHDAHGTAVTSIASAPADSIGIQGLWPGMRMLAVASDLSCSDAAAALRRAVRRGVRVVNMSYVQEERCFSHTIATQEAVRKGVILVAAAGNEFDSGSPKLYPAGDPHVISVGALAQNLQVTDFSNSNNDVDLVAPGLSIAAAVPQQFDNGSLIPGYDYLDGTSVAAPFVASAAAWIAQERPGLTSSQISELLMSTAAKRDLGLTGYDKDYGYGLLNIKSALVDRAPKRDFAEPNDDIQWIDGTFSKGKSRRIIAPGRRKTEVRAHLRRGFDPADVYRLEVCHNQQITARLKMRKGRAQLTVFDHDATSINKKTGLLGKRASTKGKDGVMRISWDGPRRRDIYLAVKPSTSFSGSSVDYDLNLKSSGRGC